MINHVRPLLRHFDRSSRSAAALRERECIGLTALTGGDERHPGNVCGTFLAMSWRKLLGHCQEARVCEGTPVKLSVLLSPTLG